MFEKSCGTCAHFRATPEKGRSTGRPDEGNCARFPPVPVVKPVMVKPTPANPQGVVFANEGAWPPVFGEVHWCGEWIAAPSKLVV